MGKAPPAFQLYAADFLIGSARMTNEEAGIYIRLLCNQWIEGGSLELDGIQTLIQGSNIPPRVTSKFSSSNGRIHNERLELERLRQQEYRKQQSDKGKASAASRKQKTTTVQPQLNSGCDLAATETQLFSLQSSSSVFGIQSLPSSSLSTSKENTIPSTSSGEGSKPLAAVYSKDFEGWYSNYPRRVGKQSAFHAYTRAIQRIRSSKAMDIPAAVEWLNEVTSKFSSSSAGNSGSFTPHPSTWLNQGRYEDDPGEWERVSSSGADADPRGNFAVLDAFMRKESDGPNF